MEGAQPRCLQEAQLQRSLKNTLLGAAMVDQEYVRKTIRAYMSISVMMNSEAVLSPETKSYLQDLSKKLEKEIATFRTADPLETERAA